MTTSHRAGYARILASFILGREFAATYQMIDFADGLERLKRRLPMPATGRPQTSQFARAAVAIVLRDREDEMDVLVIQRAENPDDPWSGHLALPGGRLDAADESLLATAAREVEEEVGLRLSIDTDFLGELGAVSPGNPRLPPIAVTPFVALARYDAELTLSVEVAAAFWVPVMELKRLGLSTTKRFIYDEQHLERPAYPSERGPIWGLTERIISDFLRYLD